MCPNLEWSCQRCTSVVVPVYGILPRGGGWGNVWLKNNVVPTLGQHWDFASINNHYTTIITCLRNLLLLLLLLIFIKVIIYTCWFSKNWVGVQKCQILSPPQFPEMSSTRLCIWITLGTILDMWSNVVPPV